MSSKYSNIATLHSIKIHTDTPMDLLDNTTPDTIQLQAQELDVISNQPLLTETELDDISKVVYARMITGKSINKPGLKNMIASLWQNKVGVQIEDYSDGIIILTFETQAGKNRMLKGQPWQFAGSYLILTEARASEQISAELFSQITFWVQVHGVPPAHMSKPHGERLGKAIANSMGEFLDFDHNNRRRFLRFQVRLDVTRPLLRGKLLNLEKNKDNIWVFLRYEKLSKFCYFCGCLDHIQKGCALLLEEIEKGHAPVMQYDDSLKAKGLLYEISPQIISTTKEKTLKRGLIADTAREATRNRAKESTTDQSVKRLRLEYTRKENQASVGEEEAFLLGRQERKQKEEGKSTDQINMPKSIEKGEGSSNHKSATGGHAKPKTK